MDRNLGSKYDKKEKFLQPLYKKAFEYISNMFWKIICFQVSASTWIHEKWFCGLKHVLRIIAKDDRISVHFI